MGAVRASASGVISGERSRWGLWLPVMLGAGIAVYFSLDDEPALWIGPLAFALCGILALLLGRRPLLQLLIFCSLFVAIGFAAAQFRTWMIDAPVLERKTGPVWVEGWIVRVEPREKDRRITLDVLTVARLPVERTQVRVRLRVSQRSAHFRPGDRVRLKAVLHPPSGPAAPGAFDFARRAYFQRLGAVGYVVRAPEIVATADSGGVSLFI